MNSAGAWMDSVWAVAALQALVLGPAAALIALLLRRSGAPGGRAGAAIAAGVFVGLAAGPGILGRVWPLAHERVFVGGEPEARALGALLHRQETDRAALAASRVTPTAVAELEADHRAARRPLEEDLAAARRGQRERLDLLGAFAVALHLLLCGPMLAPATGRGFGWLVGAARATTWRAPAAGVLATGLAALPPIVLTPFFAPLNRGELIGLGLVLGIPGLAVVLRPGVYVACASGLGLALATALAIGASPGLAIAGAGLTTGLLIPLGSDSGLGLRIRRPAARVALGVTLPLVVALGAVRLDPAVLGGASVPVAVPGAGAGAAAIWPALIIALLWSNDGRWVAWRTAWRLVGWERVRRAAWSAGSAPLDAGAAPAQACAAVVLAGAGLVNDGVMAGALAGALLVALVGHPRRWLSRRMDEGPPGGEPGRRAG